jgi:hypothetical protein
MRSVSELPKTCWVMVPKGVDVKPGQPLLVGAPPSKLTDVQHADAYVGTVKDTEDGKFAVLVCVTDQAQRALKTGASLKNDLSLMVGGLEPPVYTPGAFYRKYAPQVQTSFWNSRGLKSQPHAQLSPVERGVALFGSKK